MDDIPLAAQWVALAVLLVISGFFSIAETSMMAANRYRLKALVRLGHRGAILATKLLERTDRLLGVILLGNTLVAAGAATLAAFIAHALFGDSKWIPAASALAVTFALLVFSEITPKVIGAAYAEALAVRLSFVLVPMLRALYPVVWIVNLFVTPLLRIFRIKSERGDLPQRLSMEELRSLVLESGQFMPKKHQSILVNLFDIEAITVEDIMTPRAQIEAIDLDAPMENIVAQLSTAYHRRLPVYHGELGNVVGILLVRKVLRMLQTQEFDQAALAGMLAEPYFIPAGTAALPQLQYFQENHQRLALVVDEYGEIQGLVTLEAIIEEIIGEFTTSTPAQSESYTWDKDGTVLVEGSRMLRELNRKLALAFPLAGPKTLNGLILEYLQDIPEVGVSVKIADIPMEIVQTQDRVIKMVRLFKPHHAESDRIESR